jgi:serine/threonine-protein kinase
MPAFTELDGFEQTAYRPILRLSEGAVADVLLAEHTGLEKLVVIKVLRAEAARDPLFVERLRLEAQTLSRFTSPHLPLVTDVGRTLQRRPYFVMEHLLGHTLDKELSARGALGVADAISVARQILEGLAVVHAAGIVHRAISPEHLFLVQHGEAHWTLKILNFGMAKVVGVDDTKFAPRPVALATRKCDLQTLSRCLAPEQISGEPVDERVDVYAVGCVLFTALTGHPPFVDSAHTDFLQAHLELKSCAPSAVATTMAIPPALDAAVLRALAKAPADRFPTARAFSDELAKIAALGSTVSDKLAPEASSPTLGESQANLFRPGDTFERFEITELIGSGFMGEVYEVAHRHQDRRYAIKFLRLTHRTDVDKVERSVAEAEAMMRMDHANIVRVHDAGVTADGTVWMRMDRLHGKTLRELMARTRLSAITALHVAEEIAWGLDHAHEHSVIHRDVKPENVFVTTEPRVVLLDLGLAKFIPYDLKRTSPLRLLGTMAYAAPERLAGATLVDGRVDIYALGVLLFEVLAGEHPFADVVDDAAALGHAHLTREPQRLVELGLPTYIDVLVRQLMAKDPDRRFFTAADSAKALRVARLRLMGDVREGSYPDDGLRLDVAVSSARREHLVEPPLKEETHPPAEAIFVSPARRRGRMWPLGAMAVLLAAAGVVARAWLRAPAQELTVSTSPSADSPTAPVLSTPTSDSSAATEVAALLSASATGTSSSAPTSSSDPSTRTVTQKPRVLPPPVKRPKLPF